MSWRGSRGIGLILRGACETLGDHPQHLGV
jgi:hypothetical protein